MAHLVTTGWLPESEPEKDSVLEQLQRLFTHHAFKNSKRSQTLLRYIVEHHLQSGALPLKERTLGIDVFGRDADYDTNSDPVVRTTASEVRKRIAQYYHERGHENEIRIELPLGSYVPEFYPPSVVSPEPAPSAEAPIISPERAITGSGNRVPRQWSRYAIAACVLAILIGLVAWGEWRSAPSALSQFWGPVTSSAGPIQLCVGTWSRSPATSTSPSTPRSSSPTPDPPSPRTEQAASATSALVAWPDLVTSSKIIGFFENIRKGYRVENATSTPINDLTEGPVVLIAAYNNPWTLGITDALRFHFVRKNHQSWIADRQNPSKQYSLSPGTLPGSIRDYAIVGRLLSGTTGQISVVVAGLGAAGTVAAGDFVTTTRDMEKLTRRLPKDWQSKNLEALISVETVNGQPGAPSVQAVEVW